MKKNTNIEVNEVNISAGQQLIIVITVSVALIVLGVSTVVNSVPLGEGVEGYKYVVSGKTMTQRAFVYTELQVSVPFEKAPWAKVNSNIKKQPGFINKTWLSGVGNNSLGGFYAFDSIENAKKFVTGYFPNEARNIGVAQTSRIFDAVIVGDASRDMNSVHFGAKADQKPGAFVYTEVQVNVPFENAPWPKINPNIKKQPGFLSKTWLSGLNNNTIGGIYAFDTIENAQIFALNYFPARADELNAAFYTRVFNAGIAEEASRQMRSPFFN